MGHGQSKGRHLANSYQKNAVEEKQKAGDEEMYVKELPRVHGAGSVTTTNCLYGTSLCLSGGSTGVCAETYWVVQKRVWHLKSTAP